MGEGIKENGKMENNMEKEFLLMIKEKQEADYGKMEKELNGQRILVIKIT